MAENAGSHGAYIPDPHESISKPTGNIGPRELPPVQSGEVFYEGQDPYAKEAHVADHYEPVYKEPSYVEPAYVEPVQYEAPVYVEPKVYPGPVHDPVPEPYQAPNPYKEPPIVHNHGNAVHVHEGGDDYHKHITGDPHVAEYVVAPVHHKLVEPVPQPYVEPVHHVEVIEPVYHEPAYVEPAYVEPVQYEAPVYVEPKVYPAPVDKYHEPEPYIAPNPYKEPPIVHNHGNAVHVHEGGDDYHKHITGDPHVAEYVEAPVHHKLVEPVPKQPYVEPVHHVDPYVEPVHHVEPAYVEPVVHRVPPAYVEPIHKAHGHDGHGGNGNPYKEIPIVHNHGNAVHLHEGGDEYHKHITGDPHVAEYVEAPVHHKLVEPVHSKPIHGPAIIARSEPIEPAYIEPAPVHVPAPVIIHVEPVVEKPPYVAPVKVEIVEPKPVISQKPDWLNSWASSLKVVPAPSLTSLEPVKKAETTGSYYSGYKRSW